MTNENGVLQLKLKKLKLADEGEYVCKIGNRETRCKLLVEEGEIRAEVTWYGQ